MQPYYLLEGDNLEILPRLGEASVHSIVTDPPAGIEMGKLSGRDWDCFRRTHNPNDVGRESVFGRTSRTSPHSYGESDRGAFVAFMVAAMGAGLRVLKPGGSALVWAHPRTSHWTAWALEDAGFEIRDVLVHIHSQGMPKSKALLKPGSEHWILCRKPGPLIPLNLDPCRTPRVGVRTNAVSQAATDASGERGIYGGGAKGRETHQTDGQRLGGWPPNVLFSHAEGCGERRRCEACEQEYMGFVDACFECGTPLVDACAEGCSIRELRTQAPHAVEFFHKFRYLSKPGRKEKRAGLDNDDVEHPTVKSLTLMEWLITLITPPGGTVLDMFAGSGTTLIAAVNAGFKPIGIERDSEYAAMARRRLEHWCGRRVQRVAS